MKIVGIVVEYNPFHNGHLYQINKIKEDLNADAIVVVMSGNFAQRGIPCITDKYTRTRMALRQGVDMVLELPVPFATSSAQYFAEASIGILHHSRSIHTLCFGSESSNLELLSSVAKVLLTEPPEVSACIQSLLSQGVSFPKARQQALITYLKDARLEHLLQQPNAILGIEYIKALLKYKSTISCYPIKRVVADYHDSTLYQDIASASAIRHAFSTGNKEATQSVLPDTSFALLRHSQHPIPSLEDFSSLFQYKNIVSSKENFYTLWDVPKNLCHSIIESASTQYSLSEIINQVTSKTYSRATVQRAILRILLDVKSQDISPLQQKDWTPYIRVLGCHPKSRHVLSYMCKNSDVPIITSLSKSYKTLNTDQKILMDYELLATKLYALITNQPSLALSDFTHNTFPFDL